MSAIAPANVSQAPNGLPSELLVKILTENFTFEELKVLRGVCQEWNAHILDRMNQLWLTLMETFPYIECRSTIEEFSSDQLALLRDISQIWCSEIANEKIDGSSSQSPIMPSAAALCRFSKLLRGYEGDDFDVNFIHLAKRIAEVEKQSTVALFVDSIPGMLRNDFTLDRNYAFVMGSDYSKYKTVRAVMGCIKNIPNSLYMLQNLKNFRLKNHFFTQLPSFFGALQNLQSLNLSKNQLTSLPREIGELQNLKKLKVSHNQLTALPPSIGQLKKLKELKISDNQLKALPEALGNLTQLGEIWASGNQIESIPKSVGELTNLDVLNFRNNRLTELPDIFCKLDKLCMLSVAENQISELPPSLIALKERNGFLSVITEDIPGDVFQATVRRAILGHVNNIQNLDLRGV